MSVNTYKIQKKITNSYIHHHITKDQEKTKLPFNLHTKIHTILILLIVVATTTDPASFGPATALLAMPGWQPGPTFQVPYLTLSYTHTCILNF